MPARAPFGSSSAQGTMATERSEHEETPVAVTHVEVTTGPLEGGDESAVSVCWQSVDETTAISPEADRQAAGAADCFLVLGRVSGDQPNASVAGFALREPAWWYGPGMVSATLIVGRHMWGQGVGRRLWRCVLDETDRRAR